MPNNKMLIDATHPEETRVVVLRNGRVEEFDFESAARKLLRGNIYLAKVTRVEPSLQAAFIDYGGNRHGFLAFNEIHPDYYQIPFADRRALLEEEAAAEAAEEAAVDAHAERVARNMARRSRGRDGREDRVGRDDRGHRGRRHERAAGLDEQPRIEEIDEVASEPELAGSEAPHSMAERVAPDDVIVEEAGGRDAGPETAGEFVSAAEIIEIDDSDDTEGPVEAGAAAERDDDEDEGPDEAEGDTSSEEEPTAGDAVSERAPREDNGDAAEAAAPAAEPVEQTGSEDVLEEVPYRPRRRARSYKIQEVIKRRQIVLVQVVKEERGNKGAALTTYLSLAGRYTVLMPNTARGGGISRKITNPQDRKRLKAIAAELEVPEGMGLIIRTAGAARTKQEIKRDFEYLLRLWESVRDLTLSSTAPSLVYEEGNLIKRSIRDLYNKDVEEIVVAGREAHEEAHDFMRMLMPSHAKNVIQHSEHEPLFTRYGIETQLNAMFSPFVTLRSGGYLVINQTEALVAIDVNSGKSTREFSIEETALNTNLEAADEISRQLRLRDLAGLIVIDFIDMEEKRNNRAVERRLKDALRFDRARIQLGHISHFGLMEMSRQRLRSGVLEGSTSQCPHCQGTGIIRSTESVALAVLRGLEDALMSGHRGSLVATTTAAVALYILNNKRRFITDMEGRFGISIAVQASDKLQGANFTIERGHARPEAPRRAERGAVNMDWGFEGEGGEEPAEEAEEAPPRNGQREAGLQGAEEADRGGEDGGRRRRRRRRRGRGRDRMGGEAGFADQNGYEVRGDDEDGFAAAGPGHGDAAGDSDAGSDDEAGADMDAADGPADGAETERDERSGEGERGQRRRRRGRRGGRRRREGRGEGNEEGGWQKPALEDDTAVVDDFAGTAALDSGVLEGSEQALVAEAPAVVGRREHVGSRGRGGRGGRGRRGEASSEADAGPSDAGLSDAGPSDIGPSDIEQPATAAPRPVEVRAPEPAPAEPAKPARARRSNDSTSEPKLERVVVKPDAAETAADETEAPPVATKRGWWQRTIGG